MFKNGFFASLKPIRAHCITCLLLSSFSSYASFIESTVGTAVINDATATYYNPAALTLLKDPQLISLGSVGVNQNSFAGQVTQLTSGLTLAGTSNTKLNFFLPSFYLGVPAIHNITVGLAVIANDFNRDIEGYSILRYAQSSNQIQDIDIVPAFGYKFNDFISLGAGLNRSHAHFLLQPIFGFPNLNIPDSKGRNNTSGDSFGWDVGLLVKPAKATIMGFNYRSAIAYDMRGTSIFNGPPKIISDNYSFNYWTPGRSTFSINHFVTPKLGIIGTVQYIEWSIFKKINIHNIALPNGVLANAVVPYNFHNTWLLTLGSNYRMSPKWIIRTAATYTQAPSNGRFQIDTGDSITTGVSMGYTVLKYLIVDCSYAHAFIQNQRINVATRQNTIDGVNKASVNAVALKLTVTA